MLLAISCIRGGVGQLFVSPHVPCVPSSWPFSKIPHPLTRCTTQWNYKYDIHVVTCRDTWSVIYNRRSSRHRPPASPNVVPATKNYSPKFQRNIYNAGTIRAGAWSENDPKMKQAISPQSASQPRWPPNRGDFSRSPWACSLKNTTFLAPVIIPTFTQKSDTSITLELHQSWLN